MLTEALGTWRSPARAASADPMRSVSSFGGDADALQRAFDWAHGTRGALLLDREVIVGRTVFMGNLHLVDGGGRIFIRADTDFENPVHTSPRGWAAISMRSAPQNTAYGEPIDSRYLVRIERGCRIDFVRSHVQKPRYPIRFTGLAEGSYMYPAFTARCTVEDECNGPDWYFYNRCRIGGTYGLALTRGNPHGGFWLRDVDENALGPAFFSSFQLDEPNFSKVGGVDECVAIFTTFEDPGHLRARGSLTVSRSTSLGFTILNRSKAQAQDFDVALDTVRVRSTVRDDQPVTKIIDDNARIADLEATVTGQARGTSNAAVLQCINQPGSGSQPRIGRARLTSEGAGENGYGGVRAIRGQCSIDRPTISRLRGEERR